MKSNDIAHTRRANLKAWIEKNGTPSKERSYFSQLVVGDASFGERAARRLERDYGMGEMYLDTAPATAQPGATEAPQQAGEPEASYGRTVLARVDMDELELLSEFREKTRRGKDVILAAAKVAEKQPLSGLRRHKG